MREGIGGTVRTSAILFAVVILAACDTGQRAEQAAKPAPPTPATSIEPPAPPLPPETSLGKLVKVERSSTAPLRVMCSSGGPRAFLGVTFDGRKVKKSGDLITSKIIESGKSVFVTEPGVEVTNGNLDQMGLALCPVVGPAGPQRTFVVLTFEGKRARGVNEPGEMSEYMNFRAVSAANYLTRVEGQSWLTDSAGLKTATPAVATGTDRTQLAFDVRADATGLVWHDGKKAVYELEPHPRILPAPPTTPTAAPPPAH